MVFLHMIIDTDKRVISDREYAELKLKIAKIFKAYLIEFMNSDRDGFESGELAFLAYSKLDETERLACLMLYLNSEAQEIMNIIEALDT